MVEKTLMSISSEELEMFGKQLSENKENPETALQLFKVLSMYTFTAS